MPEFATKNSIDPIEPITVVLGASRLDCAEVAAVAYQQASVTLSPIGSTRATEAHVALQAIVKQRPVYGRTTGVGANKDYSVDSAVAPDHGLQLLRSHATSAGPAVDPAISRAMLAIRANQLGAGGSGVNPAILDGLIRAINLGVVPPIKRYGGIGTGDLPALATTALCLKGEKPWLGGSMPACEIDSNDALAFISSGAATLAEAALASHELRRRLDISLKVAALSFIALGGSMQAYAAEVHAARPYPSQIATATDLRQLLQANVSNVARHVQDRYSLRALPQVHGLAQEASDHLDQVLSVEMNAASENPLISTSAHDVFHNGNFYSGHVTAALDSARTALYGVASLSMARLGALMDPAMTGLKPFLASGPETSSGAMILEYVGQSALAELRHLATPDSLGNVTISQGSEDHASFATQSAWHTTASVPAYQTVLACELVAAVRTLRQQNQPPRTGALKTIFETATAEIDSTMPDRDLGPDIEAAEHVIHTL